MTKKTWIWIIVGGIAVCGLGLVALAGAGIYFATKHVSTARTSATAAADTFDVARARFKNVRPLIEIDADDRPRVARNTRDLPTGTVKPEHLWVLAWDPDEERVVKVSVPFWLLRLGRRKLDVMSGERRLDLDRLELDVAELERIGPALVLDLRAPSGERVLLWTQ
jgi:hypothetical protein